eukprot:Partr_v1_DN25769_c0_g1_i1_m74702 putative Nucleosome assembly protein
MISAAASARKEQEEANKAAATSTVESQKESRDQQPQPIEAYNSSSQSSEEEDSANPVQIRRSSSFNAPTPVNTPLATAPIASKQFTATLATMSEQQNSISSILTQNPQLLDALQGRLGQLVGKSSGYVESLPAPVQKRIAALENVQSECRDLTREFHREVLELEKKYELLYAPLYGKRADIAAGSAAVTAGDLGERAEEFARVEVDDKGIPEFWLTCLKNSPVAAEWLRECDEEVMKSLRDIKSIITADGFRLEFAFAANAFFSNEVLTKTYFLDDTNPEHTEVMFDHAEGCVIQWKQNKDLTVKTEIRKQRHKTSKQTRVIKKTVPNETFFTFFSPPQMPKEEDEEEEEYDEEEAEQLQGAIQYDYELGEHLREHIVPRAVDWFTGKAAAEFEEDDEEYDEEDMEGIYDDDEDDDEDEDEEDSEDEAPPKRSNARRQQPSVQPTAAAPPAGQQQQECKQQ